MTYVDMKQIFKSILKHYDQEEHEGDDNWHCDARHEEIDAYCVRYDYEAKEIVDKYGVFKAIKLYQDQYGEYVIDDNEHKNYMLLYYLIIEEQLMDDYQEKLENYKGDYNEDEFRSDGEDSCYSEDGPRPNINTLSLSLNVNDDDDDDDDDN